MHALILIFYFFQELGHERVGRPPDVLQPHRHPLRLHPPRQLRAQDGPCPVQGPRGQCKEEVQEDGAAMTVGHHPRSFNRTHQCLVELPPPYPAYSTISKTIS